MFATKIPSLLDVMIADAALDKQADPIYECKMGWCTQCACSKASLEDKYGPVHYRTEPRMMPVKDKVLPCISIQTKYALTMEVLKDKQLYASNVTLRRNNSVLARLPSPSEIGGTLKTFVVSAGRVIVGSTSTIREDSVIIRNPISLDGVRYTDMLMNKEKFFALYSIMPCNDFSSYKSESPVNAIRLGDVEINAWEKDPDGKCYYRKGVDIFEVGVGSIITENGNAVTESMSKRLTVESALNDAPVREISNVKIL